LLILQKGKQSCQQLAQQYLVNLKDPKNPPISEGSFFPLHMACLNHSNLISASCSAQGKRCGAIAQKEALLNKVAKLVASSLLIGETQSGDLHVLHRANGLIRFLSYDLLRNAACAPIHRLSRRGHGLARDH
jgi:hypothetical protein